MFTRFLTRTRPDHRLTSGAISRGLVMAAGLALVAAFDSAAQADPIMGTVSLTIAQDTALGNYGGGVATGPVQYFSGTVNLSQLFQSQTQSNGVITTEGINLTGSPLLPGASGLLNLPYTTTFEMKITFDGAAGTQPTIDVSGVLKGSASGEPNGTAAGQMFETAYGIPTSATLEGWTAQSGIPTSLIDKLLAPSNYYLSQEIGWQYNGSEGVPSTATISLLATSSVVTAAPEPATVLVYLAAIAGFGVRRIMRRPRGAIH